MRPIYSNDRKAPRMKKAQFITAVITKELHKRFTQEFPEYKDLPWPEFTERWKEITEVFRKESIHNPLGAEMGHYLGEIKLQYLPYKMDAADHDLSQKLGEKVRPLNLSGRGKIATIKWERRKAVKFNKILQFYAFNEVRELNRIAAKYMVDNYEKLRISRITTGGPSVWRQKLKE